LWQTDAMGWLSQVVAPQATDGEELLLGARRAAAPGAWDAGRDEHGDMPGFGDAHASGVIMTWCI
jgi:hypothetical protein